MSNETPELLPCPFCGGRPAEIDPTEHNALWSIECTECAVCVVLDSRVGYAPYPITSHAEAIEAWNRRAARSSGEAAPAEAGEIRRQRNAWRDYAEHLDHCVECSQMGPIGDCFERKELEEATKCTRCGGSARLLPDVECPICAEPRR